LPKVGVLALQGDFEAHRKALQRAGATAVPVRTVSELDEVDGLVIPGGESTTMLKLLHEEQMFEPLRAFGTRKPIFGTCAGAILMAKEVFNPAQESLGLCDLRIERNAYGRQLDSRVAKVRPEPEFTSAPDGSEFEVVFIRAPIIRSVSGDAKVLARYNGDPVLVEQGRHLVATFHPELTADSRVHDRFLAKLQ
jgi:5'-phosphate synthase pdxT subunit